MVSQVTCKNTEAGRNMANSEAIKQAITQAVIEEAKAAVMAVTEGSEASTTDGHMGSDESKNRRAYYPESISPSVQNLHITQNRSWYIYS